MLDDAEALEHAGQQIADLLAAHGDDPERCAGEIFALGSRMALAEVAAALIEGGIDAHVHGIPEVGEGRD